MKKIRLKDTKIFMGQLVSIKAQFQAPIGAVEDVFTYTYAKIGVVHVGFKNEVPKELNEYAERYEREAMNRLKDLDDEINERKTVILEPEQRTRITDDFDGSYVRYEYGYAICFCEDNRDRGSELSDFEQLELLEVGEDVTILGKEFGTEEDCQESIFEVYNIRQYNKGLIIEFKQTPTLCKAEQGPKKGK